MFFRQLIDADLGCASYVIADAGEAIVVDPSIAIDQYLELAAATASASRTSSRRTRTPTTSRATAGWPSSRARPSTSARRGAADFVSFPLAPGDSIAVGSALLTARATPGHRPGASRARAERPRALRRAAGAAERRCPAGRRGRPPGPRGRPREGARALHAALRGLDDLGDEVEIWPGHIGGSLCGGANLSQKPSSTLGYERRANPYLAIRDAEAFADRLLGSLPPRPPQAGRVAELNRARVLPELREPPLLGAATRAPAR